ncbi:hypothetical protein [Amycolatopsis sp. CA-230715]|uniref:hypothetical protein n=1 Tax=Amycolatopsis sp. CA-230715 TaxID=2745196 RepID=UPI001C034E61|nr:hypothetical protein [Amycolatopsis sp. CA-230715]QWF80280.1 hypothetical protein HUW46_03699 [Amycolatopsis sp. CA-230715]
MSTDDELDTELRRLFGDERLDVTPRAGAEDGIVSGARRIRRRRSAVTAGAGALTATALVAGGLIFATVPSQNAAAPSQDELARAQASSVSSAVPPPLAPPPVPQTSVNTSSAPVITPPPSQVSGKPPSKGKPSAGAVTPTKPQTRSSGVLGPDGYGALKIGMSFDDAVAAGLLAKTAKPPVGCGTYDLAEGAAAVDNVRISEKAGVNQIWASGAATPEGIGVGSTEEAVKKAYPSAALNQYGQYVVPSAPGATYELAVHTGTVNQFHLTSENQDCTAG